MASSERPAAPKAPEKAGENGKYGPSIAAHRVFRSRGAKHRRPEPNLLNIVQP